MKNVFFQKARNLGRTVLDFQCELGICWAFVVAHDGVNVLPSLVYFKNWNMRGTPAVALEAKYCQ